MLAMCLALSSCSWSRALALHCLCVVTGVTWQFSFAPCPFAHHKQGAVTEWMDGLCVIQIALGKILQSLRNEICCVSICVYSYMSLSSERRLFIIKCWLM